MSEEAGQSKKSAVQTTGHAWDGDIQEYNNPVPRWWIWAFYGTLIFSVVYWIIFPAFPIGKSYYHYVTRDYRSALEELQAVDDPSAFPAGMIGGLLVGSAVMLKEYDLAHSYMVRSDPSLTGDKDIVVDSKNVYAAVLMAFIEQKRNRHREALDLLNKAEPVVAAMPRLGKAGHGIKDVHILTMQGRPNAAIEALMEAVEEGFVSSHAFDVWPFDDDPIIEPLRSDPRYPAIKQRIDERIEEMRENVERARASGDWSELLDKAKSETA